MQSDLLERRRRRLQAAPQGCWRSSRRLRAAVLHRLKLRSRWQLQTSQLLKRLLTRCPQLGKQHMSKEYAQTQRLQVQGCGWLRVHSRMHSRSSGSSSTSRSNRARNTRCIRVVGPPQRYNMASTPVQASSSCRQARASPATLPLHGFLSSAALCRWLCQSMEATLLAQETARLGDRASLLARRLLLQSLFLLRHGWLPAALQL